MRLARDEERRARFRREGKEAREDRYRLYLKKYNEYSLIEERCQQDLEKRGERLERTNADCINEGSLLYTS